MSMSLGDLFEKRKQAIETAAAEAIEKAHRLGVPVVYEDEDKGGALIRELPNGDFIHLFDKDNTAA